MNKQKGVMTFFIITVFISVIVVLGLCTFRLCLHAQYISLRRIESRVLEWQLTGMVDCAAEKIIRDPFHSDVEHCRHDDDDVDLDVTDGMVKTVTATANYSNVSLKLALPTPDTAGVIKSNMKLVFLSNVSVSPDPGVSRKDNDWPCSSVIYSQSLHALSLSSSHPYLSSVVPYLGFPAKAHCQNSHYSVLSSVANAKLDFRHESKLALFYDLWHINEKEWFSLMSNQHIGHVPDSFTNHVNGSFSYTRSNELPLPTFNHYCADKIANEIRKRKRIIWVYGGCELSRYGIATINDSISMAFEHGGIILVVQDGVLSIHADEPLNGLLMHFVSDRTFFSADQWLQVSNVTNIKKEILHSPFRDIKTSLSLHSLAYYQQGFFYPLGGLILSGKSQYALIQTRYFLYRKDLITEALSLIRPVERISGSWDEK